MPTVDPKTFRRRLAVVGVFLFAGLVAIGTFHARDAMRHGESVWPVVIGLAISVAVIVVTLRFVTRRGVAQVGTEAARLNRWVAPAAAVIAILGALAWWLGAAR